MKKFNTRTFTISVLSSLAIMIPAMSEAASHRKIVYIDQYDQNFDGRVSSIEFEMARRSRFDITDANHNGVVDTEEYVFEWEDRLDAQLAHDRREQIDQTATRFDSLDDDKNELISRAEIDASGEWSVARFDSNEDGFINDLDVDPMAGRAQQSRDDMSREQILVDQKRMLEMPSTHSKEGTIVQYDRDGDEVVTHEEFMLGRTDYFQAMDANGNGTITEQEYLYEFEDRVDAAISRFRKESIEQAYVRFGALDADENDIMTFEEYQKSGHRSFKRWDTDNDGYVSLEEADPLEPEFSSDESNNNASNEQDSNSA